MKQKENKLTNTDVNLSQSNLVRNLVHGCQTRRALTVDGVEGRGVGDASSEGGHARSRRATAGGEHISDRNILNERGIEADLGVDGAQDLAEDLLGARVLEAALLGLRGTFRSDTHTGHNPSSNAPW